MSITVPTTVPVADAEVPVTLDDVREHVTARALTPSGTGTVGLELERHVADLRAPGRRVPWDRLTSVLAGFTPPAGSRITLEPGGQLELSTPPGELAAVVAGLERDAAATAEVLAADGLVLNSTGLDPLRGPQRVHPASRYRAMADHFDAAGHHDDGAAMMCSTASLQVNLDAGPAAGWADRLAHVHRLVPVLVALAASSPVRRGAATGAVCGRQGVWRRLEPGRCRLPGGGADPVGDWTEFALAAPVMFVRSRATGECEPVRAGVALADWAAGRVLLDERAPTAADVDAHLSTLWPPVRLRGFLELRFLDAVPAPLRPGLAALVATVVDDPVAADAAAEAAGPVAHRQEQAVRDGLADDGLHRAALGVLAAAAGRLAAPLAASLHPWLDLVESGRGPADLVLDRFHAAGPAACLIAEDAR